MMFLFIFLACQEQSAIQGVGYGHQALEDEEMYFSSSEGRTGLDASGFEFLPEELEVSLLVNEYRQAIELPPMTLFEEFSLLAREHSEAMASGDVALGHHGFQERYQMATSVAILTSSGENVAMNFALNDPVVSALDNWLTSEGHRENIEGNFNLTGVGVARSVEGAIYFTQLFFAGEMIE
jgi:uncharacterized protein YkwD